MNTPYVFPTAMRVLAPAPGCASPGAMLRARRLLLRHDRGGGSAGAAAETVIAEACGAASVRIYGSGKEALFRVFSALGESTPKRSIGLAAYTCPDVACAALRAGFKVYPLEINEETIDIAFEKIEADVIADLAGVVLSNLYGLPDQLHHWKALQQDHEFLLIDDACQAFASSRGSRRIGGEPGTIGILSFGRGKAVSGIGGGAVLINPSLGRFDCLGKMLEKTDSELPAARASSAVREATLCALQWIFGSPLGYRIPSSLPFLGLGRTHCDMRFGLKRPGGPALWQAVAQLNTLAERSRGFVRIAQQWCERLQPTGVQQPFLSRGFAFDGSVVPIRYPVLINDPDRRDVLLDRALRKGLGASGSYPAPLQAFKALDQGLIQRPGPRAEYVARRILTLPVHRYVRREYIDAAVALFKEV